MEPAEATEEAARPARPWAQGIGLLLLGLAVAAVSNALAMQGTPGAALRTASLAGWLAGVAVSGAGVHRVLWVRPSARRAARLAVTALVTVVAFAGTAIFLSLLFTIVQLRFRT